jgi:hypothetical protein
VLNRFDTFDQITNRIMEDPNYAYLHCDLLGRVALMTITLRIQCKQFFNARSFFNASNFSMDFFFSMQGFISMKVVFQCFFNDINFSM